MGSSLKAPIRNGWLVIVIVSLIELLGFRESSAQTLYNITFGQFAPGSAYTNASGAPNDFSSYATNGSNPSGVSSYIFLRSRST